MLRPQALLAPSLLLVALGCSSEEPAASAAPLGTHVLFDLTADTSLPENFYAQPYPSDLRLNAAGAPDLLALPNPKSVPVLQGLMEAASELPGYPVLPVAWFRFSAPIAERDRRLVPADPGSPILLIDLDPAPASGSRLIPVVAPTLTADEVYVPENVLAVSPYPGLVLEPRRRYAFVIRRSLNDAEGKPLDVTADFKALLQGKPAPSAPEVPAAPLFAPLLEALDELGIPRGEVAAATVFTTGDVVDDLSRLAQTVAQRLHPQVSPLQLDPVDGAAHERFCELVGKIRYPQFQRGTPTFKTEGLFEWAGDSIPVVQREEEAPVVVTLPKGEMPVGGYPLVLYFHGSGGLSSQAVDMGRGTTPDGENPVPGTGPAHTLSAHGFATVASALPVNPERVPGAKELAYLNFDNLKAFRDTFRQGVIEQHLLVEAIGGLQFPADVAAACGLSLPPGESQFRIRTDRLFAQGQSMGGMYTNMVGATHPRITAVVPTGAGGYWSKFIPETKLVGNLGALAAVIMGLSLQTPLDQFHPTLHTLQTAWAAAEPLAYMARLGRHPLPGHPVRPVYEPIAKDDSYFPTTIYDAVVLAYGHQQAGEQTWPTLQQSLAVAGLDGLLPYPVSNNLRSASGQTPFTGVVVQHPVDGAYDPHSIYRQLDSVKYQYGCFFHTFYTTGVAVVPAPAPLGTPCPTR